MKGEKENVDVAQLVECMTEDHEVVSSNLTVHKREEIKKYVVKKEERKNITK